MKQFILFICLLLVIPCPIIAEDSTQTILMNHLAKVSNKRGLISNETFAHSMFQLFRNHHPRQYRASDNETIRYQIFQNILQAAIESAIEPNLTFTVGLNNFSDWTSMELEVLRGNRPPPSTERTDYVTITFSRRKQATVSATETNNQSVASSLSSSPSPPAAFDYTTQVSALNTSVPIIRPVRYQGSCGSCYAFALNTLFEAQYAFRYGQGVDISNQQIVDCSTRDHGCYGGYFTTSFTYVQNYNWYLDSALKYPYKAVTSTCAATQTDGWSVGNSVYRHLTPGNATDMQQALVTYGPLWVSLYAGSNCASTTNCPVNSTLASKILYTFQSYKSGVFAVNGCITSPANNNHAMVIVGYGYDSISNLDYWKVRNSWGVGWGENGYIRIQRGVNMCNIESDAFLIAKPAP
ncbi:unnamed protein product [Rotaria sordida]|uniref:Uncharacterized protein n=1 Tax=Rotaria sordida TaxID=392033 RepID=A0A815DAD3_9BILA|nr:unnamed protein product [Rotaria sordida]CAF1477272.1 unnamed protein product [Rotaria sordida]CAF1509434.1 unnamed protein product [Rotaria sordida]CAF3859024.1 unnamed protein product [Rotaria sordida]CAF4145579.1 unnamed protein product [Rotaria sordida]